MFDAEAHITRRCTLVYEWHIECSGLSESCFVNVACDNADRQGVPFPKSWHTALRCSSLQTVADDAAKAARDEIGGDIACKLLGGRQEGG